MDNTSQHADDDLSHSTNRRVSIPYDVMRDFLNAEVEDWFAYHGYDSDVVAAQYDEDGKKKADAESLTTKKRPWKAIGRKPRIRILKWMNRWNKLHLRKFEYDGARIDKLIGFLIKSQRESYHTNPYNLSSVYYLICFIALAIWAVGSLVCGHYEAQAKLMAGEPGYTAALFRGFIGAVPAIVQITLFLFPHTFHCLSLISIEMRATRVDAVLIAATRFPPLGYVIMNSHLVGYLCN